MFRAIGRIVRDRTGVLLGGVVLFAIIVTLLASDSLVSQGVTVTSPEASGFSTERLRRMEAYLQRAVDDKQIAGMATLIARHGKIVELKTYGDADRERSIPVKTDTIFRLASMSKPITVVAVMMLMEEGKLLITDRVSKYIPAFEHTTVGVRAPGSAPGAPFTTVPAKRQITIHDMLTHTAGIGYGQGLADAYKSANLLGWYHGDKNETIGQAVERLASVPFEAQPGERWINGFSIDVLGYLVEKVSGMPLDQFLQSRIYGPLKMTDTSFFLPKEKADRLATVYMRENGVLKRAPEGASGQGHYVEGPRKAFAGGSGVVSTVGDYFRFSQMLLNGGELDGVRLLSPKTVELMTTNHVGNLYALNASNSTASANESRIGKGFGFNFELTLDLGGADRLGSPGDYGWYGAYFPRFWVDPVEQTVSIFLAQLMPSGGSDMHDKFRTMVYQAMTRSEAQQAPQRMTTNQ